MSSTSSNISIETNFHFRKQENVLWSELRKVSHLHNPVFLQKQTKKNIEITEKNIDNWYWLVWTNS